MAKNNKPETKLYRDVRPHSFRYMAINQSLRGGEHPAAEVGMQRGGYTYSSDSHDINDDTSDDYLDEGTDQMRLFNMHPAKIDYAFADHTLRSRVPTLLGMALNDAKAEGFGLTHDEELTPHSSNLAKRAMEKGLLVRNPNNPFAHDDGYYESVDTHEYGAHPRSVAKLPLASPQHIAEGQNTIRSLVRGRSGHLSTQFETTNEQMKLPGFD